MTLPDPLIVAILLLISGALAEIAIPLTAPGRKRRVTAGFSLLTTMFGSAVLAFWWPSVGGFIGLLIAAYRMVNIARSVEARMQEEYLVKVVRRTSLWLITVQALVYIVWWLSHTHNWQRWAEQAYAALFAVVAVVAVGALLSTIYSLRKTHFKNTNKSSDHKLPTISVLIPARNETAELEACLEAVLSSSYEKIEVIALDDCSQDKTPEVIRGYAHQGVRFVQGEPPKDKWLAKNQVYDQLAKEATGELLLFMGVDVRIQPQTISRLVEHMHNNELTMLSVMPQRSGQHLISMFVQPMRYWWQLSIPRYLLKKPPVLSTCWLIQAKAYAKLGGMKAVTRQIIPESYFAKQLYAKNQYAMIRSDSQVGLTTQKAVAEQIATAVRTRYPQVRRRPEYVLGVSLLELLFLAAPYLALPLALVYGNQVIATLSLVSIACLSLSHLLVTLVTNPGMWWLSWFNFPVVVLTEVFLLQLSMAKYEFSTVIWKGRNICLPVMHVAPGLPAKPRVAK